MEKRMIGSLEVSLVGIGCNNFGWRVDSAATAAVVNAALDVIPGVSASSRRHPLQTDQYTVTEANFSLFWGLAINLYESTLVSDDAPYDRFAAGNSSALTPQQQFGLKLFMGSKTGNCIGCVRVDSLSPVAEKVSRAMTSSVSIHFLPQRIAARPPFATALPA